MITGRDSAFPLRVRLKATGVEHAVFGTEDKRPAAEADADHPGHDLGAGRSLGDDWPDLPVMRRSAFACAPANAQTEVRHAALRHPGLAEAAQCSA